jgi:hypothetical protein
MHCISAATVAVLALLGLPAMAAAHRPEFIPDSATSTATAVRLADGTTSYAAYGRVEANGARVVRFRLRAGERLFAQLLVPRRSPEAGYAGRDLPQLSLTLPAGSTVRLRSARGKRFDEPFTQTSYLPLATLDRPAPQGGWYTARVLGGTVASRIVLATGTVERFGPLDAVRFPLWIAQVQTWYRDGAPGPTAATPGSVATRFWLVPTVIGLALLAGAALLLRSLRLRRADRRALEVR